MKRILLLISIAVSVFPLSAQRYYGTWMETNEISAALSTSGIIFGSNDSIGTGGQRSGFINNANTLNAVHTISSSTWWIGGIDNFGALRIKAVRSPMSGLEFVGGPYNYTSTERRKWNYIWSVSKAEIDAHIADFNDNGVIDDTIPNSILEWPGRGNQTAKGLNGVSINVNHDAAPFFDVDSDNIYTPSAGDYPLIKGDEMFWFVYNDDTLGRLSVDPLGIEVQVSAFAYNDPSSYALDHTVFLELKIINQSTNNYNDVYLGNYVDADIGCFGNDLVGSDPVRNMFYTYGEDPVDNTCAQNFPDVVRPVQYVRFINRPLDSYIGYGNDFSVTGNPETGDDYYDYLQAIWKDGECLSMDSCNGRGAGNCTSYMYPDDPTVAGSFPSVWSGLSCGISRDHRNVGTSGPHTLNAGSYITIAAVYGYAETPFDTSGVLSFDPVYLGSDTAVNHYLNDPNYVGISDQNLPNITATIYPNPSSGLFTLAVNELKGSVDIEVYNLLGEQVVGIRKVTNSNTQIDLSHLQDGIYLVKVGNKVLRVVKHQ